MQGMLDQNLIPSTNFTALPPEMKMAVLRAVTSVEVLQNSESMRETFTRGPLGNNEEGVSVRQLQADQTGRGVRGSQGIDAAQPLRKALSALF